MQSLLAGTGHLSRRMTRVDPYAYRQAAIQHVGIVEQPQTKPVITVFNKQVGWGGLLGAIYIFPELVGDTSYGVSTVFDKQVGWAGVFLGLVSEITQRVIMVCIKQVGLHLFFSDAWAN